jgi:predicted aspartyl protease
MCRTKLLENRVDRTICCQPRDAAQINHMNDMGKVTTRIRVTNWLDAELAAAGARGERPRSVETDALVDTGAVKFYLRSSIIRELGLRPVGEVRSRTMSNRLEPRTVYSPVELEIQGRMGRYDVVEVPDALPNIVGQIPLEDLDWVVDCKNQRLIPNPEHKHGELTDEF